MNGFPRISKRLQKKLRASVVLSRVENLRAVNELQYIESGKRHGVMTYSWNCPRCRRFLWKREKPTTPMGLLCNPNGSIKGPVCT